MSEKNIYKKIMTVREKWLNANVQKTGVNRFAEYTYFELTDIVPVAQKIVIEEGLTTLFDFHEDYAYLYVVDDESKNLDTVTFRSPMKELTVKGMNAIQALGAVETYQRRYLYMMFIDIVEQDEFDATQGKPDATDDSVKKEPVKVKTPTPKKSNVPVSAKERNKVKETLTDSDGEITKIQLQSIKTGLKKLRSDGNGDHEDYITEVALKLKNDKLDKTGAEEILMEIGKKIAGGK